MSFKYRFILSFVILEIIFILLIVTINFISINSNSKKLIEEKIESNIIYLEQLVKVPVSIYDLASLDNLVDSTKEYMNSIVILDANNKILSKNYSYKYMNQEELLKIKSNKSIDIKNESYEIVFKELYEDDIVIGSMYLIFDISGNTQFIENNTRATLFIIFIEILISTLLSFIIGSKLTNKLIKLSKIATRIGNEEIVKVPFLNIKDEIGNLSNSMNIMQDNLIKRNHEISSSNTLLKKQKEELKDANKSKDDFLANMSHELKTPLNSINIISSILKKNSKNNLDEEQIKSLEIINSCGNDLLYLINDVLDLSKLEAGEISLNYDEVNFTSFINTIYETILPQMQERKLDFTCEIDSTIKKIYTDRHRVNQIVKNLLSNSLKFTHKGSIKLTVKDENENIRIIVEDEGIGIPKEKLNHIFDRFKQVDESTTRKYGGTGLGLSICKELTVLLKGTIEVNSTVKKGTTFEVVIPKNLHFINSYEYLDFESNKKDEEINILVLNTCPSTFFQMIIRLKKKHKVTQTNSFDDFIKSNSSKYEKAIIDITSLNKEEISKLLELKIENLVIIYEEEIDNILDQSSLQLIKKPIDQVKIDSI